MRLRFIVVVLLILSIPVCVYGAYEFSEAFNKNGAFVYSRDELFKKTIIGEWLVNRVKGLAAGKFELKIAITTSTLDTKLANQTFYTMITSPPAAGPPTELTAVIRSDDINSSEVAVALFNIFVEAEAYCAWRECYDLCAAQAVNLKPLCEAACDLMQISFYGKIRDILSPAFLIELGGRLSANTSLEIRISALDVSKVSTTVVGGIRTVTAPAGTIVNIEVLGPPGYALAIFASSGLEGSVYGGFQLEVGPQGPRVGPAGLDAGGFASFPVTINFPMPFYLQAISGEKLYDESWVSTNLKSILKSKPLSLKN